MLSAEEILRRLTLGDRRLLAAIADLDLATPSAPVVRLDPRSEALVRLAVLVALDAPQSSYRETAGLARLAGGTLDDLVATLIAVAGQVGAARVCAAAPQLALAADYDVDRELYEKTPTPVGG